MKNDKVQGIDRRTFLKVAGVGAVATAVAPAVVSAQSESKNVKKESSEKIDAFCHIFPAKFEKELFKKAKPSYYTQKPDRPGLSDLDTRFKDMDKYEGLKQVLNLGSPPMEYALSPKDAVDLARMANDEMAELLNKYPDRFVTAVAGLPMNDVDASVREMERAIKELRFKGVQIWTPVNGKPLDRPEFMGLYEMAVKYDVPIWIHPARDSSIPDYPDETSSKYGVFQAYGWPYETTVAMARLVNSGMMEKYPTIKFIIHHCGAMIPYFSQRGTRTEEPGAIMKRTKSPEEYFKRFYGDTVLGYNPSALMCGRDFFGTDHIVFASDYPYTGGANPGAAIGSVIKSVEQLRITDEEKDRIFSKNARRMLNLT